MFFMSIVEVNQKIIDLIEIKFLYSIIYNQEKKFYEVILIDLSKILKDHLVMVCLIRFKRPN